MSWHISEQVTSLERVFQALGDPTRLRIASLLAATKQRACVCELTDALAERQYNVSRHLKILRDAGLVIPARNGRWVYYELVRQTSPPGRRLLTLLRALSGSREFAADRARFAKRLALRKHGQCCVWTAADVVVA